jgi:hypothetical protein
MTRWDERASVRRATVDDQPDTAFGLLPFSVDLYPVAGHKAVAERGPDVGRFLLTQRLNQYLDFTTRLENGIVTKVATDVFDGRFELGGGPALALDAQRIGVDEQWHALEAARTKQEVAVAVGIPPALCLIDPPFLRVLRMRMAEARPEDRLTVRLVFAIVSETLITGTLTLLPADSTVLPIVRSVVRRHARDEALHHAVFAQVAALLWSSWPNSRKDLFAHLFAEFMEAFLRPDLEAFVTGLLAAGFDRAEARAIIDDLYPSKTVRELTIKSARPSLLALEEAGIAEHPAFIDALDVLGLSAALVT